MKLIKELVEDNIRLKQEIRTLKMKLDVVKETPAVEINNADLLKLSNLKK